VAAALLPWMVVSLSLLMVSKVRYDTLPRISRRAIRKEPWKFTFAVLAVIVVVVTGGSAVFPLLLLFIALGLIRWLVSASAGGRRARRIRGGAFSRTDKHRHVEGRI